MNDKCVVHEYFTSKFSISYRRTLEILTQLLEMNYIEKTEEGCFKRTTKGKEFTSLYARGKLHELHSLLMEYRPYRIIYDLLASNKYTYEEITEKTGFNMFTIDIIVRIMKDLKIPVRRGLKNDYYTEINSKDKVCFNEFLRTLLKVYKRVTYRRRSRYVKIVEIGDEVKYHLRISDKVFRELLEETLRRYPGLITLSAAPIISYREKELFNIKDRKYVFMKIKLGDVKL